LHARTHFRRYRGRRIPFTCFALPDSFSVVPRASGTIFMFCAPGLIFGSTEGVRSRFHVLRARTHFRRYRGRRVPFKCFTLPDSFSCFAPPDSFSEVPRASGPFLTFCAPGLILSGTDGVGSLFHVLRSQTHFRWYGGHRVPFSCFALPDSFSAIPRASGPFFMFCAPRLIFGGTKGVGSRLYVLRSRSRFSAVSRTSDPVFMFSAPGHVFWGTDGVGYLFNVLQALTRFRLYRGRRVQFSRFARTDSFSAVPGASGPVFMPCAPRTRFRRFRERRVPFSCFARPDSFSKVSRSLHPVSYFARSVSFLALPRALGPVLMFCALRLVFGGIECVESCFHVLRSRTCFRRYRVCLVPFSRFALSDSFSGVPRASGLISCLMLPDSFSAVPRASEPVFMFSAPGHVFAGSEGVGSLFNVLRSLTHFRWYRWRQVHFSCFAIPDSFSTVRRVLGPIFMFCAPRLVFGDNEGVGSLFHVLRSRTHFRWYRWFRLPFSCFALPDSFSTVPRASGPVFMFCAPRTRFRRYRGRRVLFSCFVRPDSFSAVPRSSDPVFMFYAPEHVFDGTEGVGSRFHVLRSLNRFQRYRGRPIPFSYFPLSDMFLG
jgi:hypothetical protein